MYYTVKPIGKPLTEELLDSILGNFVFIPINMGESISGSTINYGGIGLVLGFRKNTYLGGFTEQGDTLVAKNFSLLFLSDGGTLKPFDLTDDDDRLEIDVISEEEFLRLKNLPKYDIDKIYVERFLQRGLDTKILGVS